MQTDSYKLPSDSPSEYEQAWKFLEEKGLTMTEMMTVRKAFAEWGQETDPMIITSHRKGQQHFKSKRNETLAFETEPEVKLFNVIHLLKPGIKTESALALLAVILKLTDYPSAWTTKID